MSDTPVTSNEVTLLPCPFCGRSDTTRYGRSSEFHEDCDGDSGNDDYFAVFCDASEPRGLGGCGASSGFAKTCEEAAERWNRRPAVETPASLFRFDVGDAVMAVRGFSRRRIVERVAAYRVTQAEGFPGLTLLHDSELEPSSEKAASTQLHNRPEVMNPPQSAAEGCEAGNLTMGQRHGLGASPRATEARPADVAPLPSPLKTSSRRISCSRCVQGDGCAEGECRYGEKL